MWGIYICIDKSKQSSRICSNHFSSHSLRLGFMDRARSALFDKASVAASEQLVMLEQLVPKFPRYGNVILNDSEAKRSAIEVVRALGYDEFQLDLKGLTPEEHRYRIGVAVVEVCKEKYTQSLSGIPLETLAELVSEKLAKLVTSRDVECVVEDMEVFGSGLKIEQLGNGEQVVRSDVLELSSEQGDVLVACDALGYVTVEMLVYELQWAQIRAVNVVEEMVRGGMLWVDKQVSPTQYWVPNM